MQRDPISGEPDTERGLRSSIGALLVLVALVLGGWIVWQLNMILNAPDSFALITALTPSGVQDGVKEAIDRGDVPVLLVHALAYFLFLGFLGVAAGLVRGLLAGGVRLLRGDAGREIAAALDRRLQHIENMAAKRSGE